MWGSLDESKPSSVVFRQDAVRPCHNFPRDGCLRGTYWASKKSVVTGVPHPEALRRTPMIGQKSGALRDTPDLRQLGPCSNVGTTHAPASG